MNNIYISELENPPSETIVMTLEEHCQKALYNVGCGLSCLYNLEDINQQLTMKKGRKMKNGNNKGKNQKNNKECDENNDDYKNK